MPRHTKSLPADREVAAMDDEDETPLVHKAVRLRRLQMALEQAQTRGDTASVLKILELAAIEAGGN